MTRRSAARATARCRAFWHDSGGFTLLEVALVLAIVGVLAGTLLPTLSLYMTRQSEQKTLTRQEMILDSLKLFARANGRLPCPAGPSGGIEPFGAELGSGRQSLDVPKECSRQIGFVPFRTLGLPASVRNDGWNRPLTYAVARPFTTTTSKEDLCDIKQEAAQGLLKLIDERGADLSPNNLVAVLIVSHGPNGSGAFVGDDSLRRVPFPPPSEAENANDNLTFQQGIYRRSEQTPFDDGLLWLNREQLVAFGDGCDTGNDRNADDPSTPATPGTPAAQPNGGAGLPAATPGGMPAGAS